MAAELLSAARLQIVARNYSCRFGEIDLIALAATHSPPQLHFVEVRYRKSDRFGSAAASVTAVKQRKIRRTAALFLQRHHELRNCHCQFDVITVSGTNYPLQTQWIEDAF